MKLRTRVIQKLIEAHARVRTHAVHVYWDIYGKRGLTFLVEFYKNHGIPGSIQAHESMCLCTYAVHI